MRICKPLCYHRLYKHTRPLGSESTGDWNRQGQEGDGIDSMGNLIMTVSSTFERRMGERDRQVMLYWIVALPFPLCSALISRAAAAILCDCH